MSTRSYQKFFQFAELEGAPEGAQEDLAGMSDEDLATRETELIQSFDSLYNVDEGVSAEQLEELNQIAQDLEGVRLEAQTRVEARAAAQETADGLAQLVHPADVEAEAEAEAPEAEAAADDASAEAPAPEAEVTEAPADEARELVTAAGQVSPPARVRRERNLNVPLSEVARRAPQVDGVQTPTLSIVAAGDVQGFATGGAIKDLSEAARAMHSRARVLSNLSGRVPVFQLERQYADTLSVDSMPEDIDRVMRKATNQEVLVAAGGWCAPSEPMYNFFDISAVDGLIDMPTVSVKRGGIRWPVSPSIADVMGDPWLWTEQDDIDAVTGSGTKSCVRVPCASWLEERLGAHGLCVTNGNLMDSAFPENTRNFLGLMITAHEHVMNSRFIADIVSQSTAITGAGTTRDVVSALLNNVELQAVDYRSKYRMGDTDILEVILPLWSKGLVRADLARQGGKDSYDVSDAEIASWFNVRNARVQFVSDWQLGSGSQFGQAVPRTGWPQTVQFILHAAGTFVKGSGMSLDLGVVRDSTLNETNDYTAAWTEESHLIAMLGHESRVVTVGVCPTGALSTRKDVNCPSA